MIIFRASCWAILVWVALVVLSVTARAAKSPVFTLFISDTIASDSAAVQAARRWIATFPSQRQRRSQSLHIFNQRNIPTKGIVLAPLVQWSRSVPALNVLRLPFFYPDLSSIHRAIDGELGKYLAQNSQTAGWKVLAIWDAGMTDFSGNQRYNRLPNLAGMQFVLWEEDPLQATELRALDVWTRVVGEHGIQRMAQECLVSSRSTTPAQMWREHLQRVHLDITLTQDRYEGYMLAIPVAIWDGLSSHERASLTDRLSRVTRWERNQAAREQQLALAKLHKAGMTIHRLDSKQRRVFTKRMPPWPRFLKQLDMQSANDLIVTARTATAAGSLSGRREETPAKSLPTTQATE